MAIYKVTYSDRCRRATLYNYGCNFRCKGCSYKLKALTRPQRFPGLNEIKRVLLGLKVDSVHFIGGESTINPDLPHILKFCKEEIGAITRLGHTNGSNLSLKNLDGANISFKAYDEELYLDYTGHSGKPVFENFRLAYRSGMELKASAIFIPNYISYDQIEGITRFISSLNRKIPFHITGYIPVPGTPWRRPKEQEMKKAVSIARCFLDTVTFSHLTSEEAMSLVRRDERFASRRVL